MIDEETRLVRMQRRGLHMKPHDELPHGVHASLRYYLDPSTFSLHIRQSLCSFCGCPLSAREAAAGCLSLCDEPGALSLVEEEEEPDEASCVA
jgi:hypothetical protein